MPAAAMLVLRAANGSVSQRGFKSVIGMGRAEPGKVGMPGVAIGVGGSLVHRRWLGSKFKPGSAVVGKPYTRSLVTSLARAPAAKTSLTNMAVGLNSGLGHKSCLYEPATSGMVSDVGQTI